MTTPPQGSLLAEDLAASAPKQPYLSGSYTARPHDKHEACSKCGGKLAVIYGPHGKSGQHFAKLGCPSCKRMERWLPWPDDRNAQELFHLRSGSICTCGAPVLWGRTKAGKPIALDPKPVTIVDREGAVVTGRVSHFATCPDAKRHRKRKR